LLAVRRIALPGALAQIAVATALGAALASLWGWSFGAGLVFGLALSVASTVVLLLVGYGRVGRRIAEALTQRGVAIVVAEQNRELVEQLRGRGIPAVSGDASEAAVLIQAHVARAQMLVIAVPDTFRARKMVEIARTLRPEIEIVVRAHSDEEAALLREEKAGQVFMGEHELALGMTRQILAQIGAGPEPR
jgi:CPA2 family monovalent cation:H+ antiporter-2